MTIPNWRVAHVAPSHEESIQPMQGAEADEPAAPQLEGLRHDDGKARMDLIPPEAVFALAQVYTVGASKYAARNWERGMGWGKCFAAMMRHAWRWMAGEDYDPETGCHHMAHAAWNALTIVVYASRRIGSDDRPVIVQP